MARQSGESALTAWSERAWARFGLWPAFSKAVAWIVGWWLLIPLLAWRSALRRGLKIGLSIVPILVVTGSGVAIALAPSNHPGHLAAAPVSPTSPASIPTTQPSAMPTARPRPPAKHHSAVTRPHVKRRTHRAPRAAVAAVSCPLTPLRGVYHPYRLHVLGACRWYGGVVTSVRHEEDGDYHVDVAPGGGFAGFLDGDNYSAQHGSLVTEIMPGQRFPVPYVGQHIALVGTWVYDADHGWNEIHPIWAIR